MLPGSLYNHQKTVVQSLLCLIKHPLWFGNSSFKISGTHLYCTPNRDGTSKFAYQKHEKHFLLNFLINFYSAQLIRQGQNMIGKRVNNELNYNDQQLIFRAFSCLRHFDQFRIKACNWRYQISLCSHNSINIFIYHGCFIQTCRQQCNPGLM